MILIAITKIIFISLLM